MGEEWDCGWVWDEAGDGAGDATGDRGGAGYKAGNKAGVGARVGLEIILGNGEGIGMIQEKLKLIFLKFYYLFSTLTHLTEFII